jgi:hypothetical protein
VKNPSGKKLEKLVFGMFDQMVEGADKYVTEQGSTWLIFAKEKKWVVEFTNDKTLWFNYNLFKSELELIGKDCTEERDLIKKWFELRFLNTPKVKNTDKWADDCLPRVVDTIQNGVKDTLFGVDPDEGRVEDTIQNGVKETTPSGYLGSIEMNGKIVHQIESPKQNNEVEDAIQNGVRQTNKRLQKPFRSIKDAIQNGVKDTKKSHWIKSIEAEDIIENGICDVKHSYDFEEIVVKDIIEDSYPHKHRVEGVIKNTVKDGI